MNETDFRNAENLKAWRTAWTLNGGSVSWTARPMEDFRDTDQQRQWRLIQFKVREIRWPTSKATVIDISAWYLKRHRNGRSRPVMRTA